MCDSTVNYKYMGGYCTNMAQKTAEEAGELLDEIVNDMGEMHSGAQVVPDTGARVTAAVRHVGAVEDDSSKFDGYEVYWDGGKKLYCLLPDAGMDTDDWEQVV